MLLTRQAIFATTLLLFTKTCLDFGVYGKTMKVIEEFRLKRSTGEIIDVFDTPGTTCKSEPKVNLGPEQTDCTKLFDGNLTSAFKIPKTSLPLPYSITITLPQTFCLVEVSLFMKKELPDFGQYPPYLVVYDVSPTYGYVHKHGFNGNDRINVVQSQPEHWANSTLNPGFSSSELHFVSQQLQTFASSTGAILNEIVLRATTEPEVDGVWTSWTPLAPCSVSCGTGYISKKRSCTNPSPLNCGKTCYGYDTETVSCDMGACPLPINGGWSVWAGTCSVTCGNGTNRQTRTCTNPAPQNGGATCSGDDTRTVNCSIAGCLVAGGWSAWTDGVCSVTCGTGSTTRTRTCSNPAPKYGGATCAGNHSETTPCLQPICIISNGTWTPWSAPSPCSVSCGPGVQLQTRSCVNGSDCVGSATITKQCVESTCKIDGGWTTWHDAGACSVSCGEGSLLRKRSCTNPTPDFGGNNCVGNSSKTINCTEKECEVVIGTTKKPIDAHPTTPITTDASVAMPAISLTTHQPPSYKAVNQPFGFYGYGLWSVWTVTIGFFITSGIVVAGAVVFAVRFFQEYKKKRKAKSENKKENSKNEIDENEPLLDARQSSV